MMGTRMEFQMCSFLVADYLRRPQCGLQNGFGFSKSLFGQRTAKGSGCTLVTCYICGRIRFCRIMVEDGESEHLEAIHVGDDLECPVIEGDEVFGPCEEDLAGLSWSRLD